MIPSIDLSAALAQRFDAYALDTSPGIVIELFGPPGAGKTDFALRAPAPVLHFGFDYHGARRPANRLMRDCPEHMKRVHTRVYPLKPRDRKGGDADDVAQKQTREEVLIPFISDFEFGVEHARTLVIDTFDMMREAQVIAKFGKLEQNSQTAYQEINAETARLIHSARQAEKIVILISRMKEEYKEIMVNGKPTNKSTGKLIPASNVRVQHSVDARLEMLDDFKLRIFDAKTNKAANGEVRESPSFADIAMLLKPDVDPEHWL